MINMPEDWYLIEKDTVKSTNEDAKRLALHKAPEGVVVWAKEQTAGRGRRTRIWISPRGNLFFSIILRPEKSLTETGQISFVSSVALIETIKELTGQSLQCKWPNDVLYMNERFKDGAKVSGLLLESSGEEIPDWVILGVGVNIAYAPKPEETIYSACCLNEISESLGIENVLETYIRIFSELYGKWKSEGFAVIRETWLSYAKGIDREITVNMPNKTIKGIFRGIDEKGALILELDNGNLQEITAGDVFYNTGGIDASGD